MREARGGGYAHKTMKTKGQAEGYRERHAFGGRTVRCARAVRALCEKLAVLQHREFGKFRRLKGRH